jgi:CheY-like chemotaxis protein
VKQVFNNLLSNAFKYTDSGTVDWTLTYERDGDYVWLVSDIKDTGRGMKPEEMEKLFSDYNQVAANRLIGGTGLGLSITKRLAEMMDGSITAESEYGKGSVFHVRLRQILASDAPIGPEAAQNLMSLRYTLAKRGAQTKLARIDLSGSHVLVVDDIPTNLDVVRGMLRPYNLKIDCANSGPQAIEMIGAGEPRYSAVFMDHMMPEMDGIEAVRVIREEIGTDYAKTVPIIALTANAIVGNEEMFLSKGFQDFISKPIDMAKLDAAIRCWVRDKSFEEMYLPPEEENPRLSSLTIEGVDTRGALERFGSGGTVLTDVWRSYAINTRPLLARLREYLESGRLADYAITVHGIKGSSYGIFATAAGRAAEKLEAAAKDSDLEAINAGHAAFEEIVETLIHNLERVLGELDASADKQTRPEPDPALLRELREASAAYDMDRVDHAMETLEAFRYERGGELIGWLREKVDGIEFEELASGDWFTE